MLKTHRRSNMFAVRCQAAPPPEPAKHVQIIEPDEYEGDYDDAPPVQMIQPKKTKKKALPGERLLRQIHRDRLRERLDEKLATLSIE